jgi:hypothetical protein
MKISKNSEGTPYKQIFNVKAWKMCFSTLIFWAWFKKRTLQEFVRVRRPWECWTVLRIWRFFFFVQPEKKRKNNIVCHFGSQKSTFLGMGMFRSPHVLWFPWFGNFISKFDFLQSFDFGTELFMMRVLWFSRCPAAPPQQILLFFLWC